VLAAADNAPPTSIGKPLSSLHLFKIETYTFTVKTSTEEEYCVLKTIDLFGETR
jgi:hypothetical protein